MKIKWHKYNRKDGELVVFHLRTLGIKCELVGGVRDKGHSNKDIDLYFSELEGTDKDMMLIAKALGNNLGVINNPGCVITEIRGIYFYNTPFGDIDCFFKHHTKEYCEDFWEAQEIEAIKNKPVYYD